MLLTVKMYVLKYCLGMTHGNRHTGRGRGWGPAPAPQKGSRRGRPSPFWGRSRGLGRVPITANHPKATSKKGSIARPKGQEGINSKGNIINMCI